VAEGILWTCKEYMLKIYKRLRVAAYTSPHASRLLGGTGSLLEERGMAGKKLS